MISTIAAALLAHRFRYTNEAELHTAIGLVLARLKVPYDHEVVLGPMDRIDFLVDDVGIEVKISRRANAGDVVRQLGRYLQSDRVGSLILVTDRAQLARLPGQLMGKPVRVVSLLSGLQ